MDQNLFTCLSTSRSAIDENYLTEALVFVLRLLLERAPVDGIRIVNEFTGSPGDYLFSDPSSVRIRTQVKTDEGTPDIEISEGDGILAYVEVKHDSPLGTEQLKRYRDQIDASGAAATQLVLLARSRTTALTSSLDPQVFACRTWYDVYNLLSAIQTDDEVSRYMTEHLMGFLEEKRMSMKRVGWTLEDGVPALLNLVDMIQAAIEAVRPQPNLKRSGGWSWRGFFLDEEYFVGVRYEDPLVVVFEDKRGYRPVTYKRDLDLRASRFFCLNKDEQFEMLVEFVQAAAAAAMGGE